MILEANDNTTLPKDKLLYWQLYHFHIDKDYYNYCNRPNGGWQIGRF